MILKITMYIFVEESYTIDGEYVKRLVKSGYGLGKVNSIKTNQNVGQTNYPQFQSDYIIMNKTN